MSLDADHEAAGVVAINTSPARRRRRKIMPAVAGIPATLMAHAFMAALMRWAARHADCQTTITIPTGYVSSRELSHVLHAIIFNQRREKND